MDDLTKNTSHRPVFLFQEGYFTEPDFLKRFDNDMRRIRHMIFGNQDRELVKEMFNQYMGMCFQKVKDEPIVIHMLLESYETLAYYGERYSSFETFENIIRDIEQRERKALLFGKCPGKAKIVYGSILLKYYGLKNDQNNGWYSEEAFSVLAKAKFYLLRAYTQSLDTSNPLDSADQAYCLVLLSACFLLLSRYFEPSYYLELLRRDHPNDSNYEYITARNLEALKERTCLDYNGQLLLKIIDCCESLLKRSNIEPRLKEQAVAIRTKCFQDIENTNLTMDRLRRHKLKVETSTKKRNAYFLYCIDHQLFLNEHALFCPCTRSVGDKLEIRTQHPHTQMPWVEKFTRILELLMVDFALARNNLFQAESQKQTAGFYKTESKIVNALQLKKDALLKNAFKMCYSILDQIAHGTFEVLDIDIEKHLGSIAAIEGKPRQQLYFLNMWELYQFKEEDFRNNVYLVTLKSISRDLDRNKYSALNSFKMLRNAMEHKFLVIDDGQNAGKGSSTEQYITREALIGKTKTLMVLTKSAIFSFTYLVRRQSKIKEIAAKQANPDQSQ